MCAHILALRVYSPGKLLNESDDSLILADGLVCELSAVIKCGTSVIENVAFNKNALHRSHWLINKRRP